MPSGGFSDYHGGMGKRLAALALAAAACGDNLTPDPDPDQVQLVALDTVAPAYVTAGDPIAVMCTMTEGDVVTLIAADVRVTAESMVRRTSNSIIAHRVGTITVACDIPSRGLIDTTPSTVEIAAGAVANVAGSGRRRQLDRGNVRGV